MNIEPKRREIGSPSIYYVASVNRWCAKIQIGYDVETGKPKRKVFYGKTLDEVKFKVVHF